MHPPLSCALPFPRPVARAFRLWSLPDMPNTALIVGESGPHSVKPKPPLRLYLQPPRRSDSVKPCLTIRLRVSLVVERQKSQKRKLLPSPLLLILSSFPFSSVVPRSCCSRIGSSLVVSLAKMAPPDSPPDLLEDTLAALKRTVEARPPGCTRSLSSLWLGTYTGDERLPNGQNTTRLVSSRTIDSCSHALIAT